MQSSSVIVGVVLLAAVVSAGNLPQNVKETVMDSVSNDRAQSTTCQCHLGTTYRDVNYSRTILDWDNGMVLRCADDNGAASVHDGGDRHSSQSEHKCAK